MLYIKDFEILSKIDGEKVTKGAFYPVLALHQNGEELLVCDDKKDLTWLKLADVSVVSQPESLFGIKEIASGTRNTVLKTAKVIRNRKKR